MCRTGRIVLPPCRAGLDADLHGEPACVPAACEGAAQMRKVRTHERPGSFEPGRSVSLAAGADLAFAEPSLRIEEEIDHISLAIAISDRVTVMAPPMRVATWAKGISCIRLAAVRMATSPVPP